jgi:polyhydroxybutyrate depolymerase
MLLLTAAVAVTALAAPVRQGTTTPDEVATTPGCGLSPPANGWHDLMVPDPLAGNTQRWVRLYVPIDYDVNVPHSLVLDIHGYSSNADEQEERTGLRQVADEQNFIVAWPHGLDDGGSQTNSWNSVGTVASPGPLGQTCQWAGSYAGYACHSSCQATRPCYSDRWANGCDCSTCADDVLFTELLLNKLEAELCIDTRRVHVTGFSNGGMMAYELAMSRLAPRIASIAPVGSSPLMGFNSPPARSMPIMDIRGSNDGIIPANCSGNACGPHNSTISCDGFYYTSVLDVMSVWGQVNSCSGPAFHYATPFDGDTDFWCWSSEGTCERETVRCAFRGGHTWPFGSGGNNRVKYARLVFEFFRANPLARLPTTEFDEPATSGPRVVPSNDWSTAAVPPPSLLKPRPKPYRCPNSTAFISGAK